MLTLSQHQHEALAADSMRRFKAEAVAHVRRSLPDRFARDGEAKVSKLVDAACARAAAHGLSDGRSLMLFVNMSCLLGPEFDADPAHPWITALLRDEDRPIAERMPALEARVYAELGLGSEKT